MHFSPSRRKIRRGEFVLIDAGAHVDRYVIDVTRTFVAGRKPTNFQRELFSLVLEAERNAISRCVPGAEWKDLHLKAAIEMTDGLIELKLMNGNAESLVEQGAHTLFFHMGSVILSGLASAMRAAGIPDARRMKPRHCEICGWTYRLLPATSQQSSRACISFLPSSTTLNDADNIDRA